MRRILYLRLPYFHSAVQALLDPALAGRAVIVAAGSYQRGRVMGVSPEAAAAGVERGMPWRPARRRCPEAALVRYERAQYAPVVEQVGVLLVRFTPWVERLNGAEDEFFAYLGEGDLDEGAALAARIQAEIAVELQLAAVLGLAGGKLAARSLVENNPAGRPDQPAPLLLLPTGRSRRFLRGRPVTDLWDLKPEAQRRLELLGVRTLGQVAALPTRALIQPLGPAARWYQRLALGIDRRRVAPWRPAPVETAACFVEESEPDLALLHGYLEQLARQIARTLLGAGRYGRSVSLLLHLPGGGRRFATRHLKEPTHLWPVIFAAASALLEQLTTTRGGVTGEEWRGRSDPDLPHASPRAAELLELRVGALETRGAIQLSIFGDEDRGPALRSAIARLQSRYGEGVIATAGKYVDAGC
jgi:DNA polymerase-4